MTNHAPQFKSDFNTIDLAVQNIERVVRKTLKGSSEHQNGSLEDPKGSYEDPKWSSEHRKGS